MKKLNKKKPIFLFDLDGVIVDSFEEAYLTNRQFVTELGLPPFTKKTFLQMYRKNIHLALKEYGVKDEKFKNLWRMIKEKEKRKVNKVTLYPQASLLVKQFSSYHLYIITSSSTHAVELFLKRKRLLKYFKEVLGSEKGISKVEKIKKVIRKEKVNAKEVYLITDTVGDVLEGRKAKVKTIAVGWGYHKLKELKAVSPNYLFKTPAELIKALSNL